MLELTVAFSHNPRLLPLIDGAVKPQNVKLNFVESHPAELFYRNLKYDEFDVSEMSISDFLISRERREAGRWQWAALPLFFLKAFYLWPAMYVNAESGIKSPADLKGKRVGVPDYQMTAALWIRVVLKELYGIQPSDIIWYNGRTKEVSHGALLGLYKHPPRGVTLNWLDDSDTFDRMLNEGTIDAATGFYPKRSGQGRNFIDIDRYGGTPMEGNPKIRKLLSDGGREIMVQYYRRQGIIPVNHMVIVQERILAQHPWLALEIYKAFQRSKEVAFERARELGAGYLLFADHSFQEQAEMFGDDPYSQGLHANRKMLEVLLRGSFEQGLTKNLTSVENIFYRTTLDT